MDISVVDGVRLASIGIKTPLQEKFPILTSILSKSKNPSKDWDFFMTSAGIAIAILCNQNDEMFKKNILEKANNIKNINRPHSTLNWGRAVSDLFNFMENYKDTDINMQSQIGLWVLWNIGGEKPSYDECKELAPIIGMYLTKVVNDFK